MASTQFLEEALSTDVDESAVTALVGSLETQLVNPPQGATVTNENLPPNHGNNGISNGGIIVQKQNHSNDDPGDGKTLTALQNATSTVVLGPNVITKTGDGVKIVTFPTGGQLSGPQVVNINKSYAPTLTLPNGTVTSASVQDKQGTLGVLKVDPGQAPGTTFVIKTPGTVPMTAGSPQAATSKPVLAQGGNTVQLINMNAVRPGVPQKGMQQQRLVINSPQVIRPGVPGSQPQFTLQTLQQLQPGAGHILVKTESGHYQLIRVGPPQPSAGTSTTLASTNATGPFRIQSVNVPQAVSSGVLVTTSAGVAVSTPPALTATTPAQKQQVDTTKEKCRKFLANLLELSTREPKAVERNVRTLIQELIDAKVEPEEFCDRLEKLLNASPQPCLIGFLKKSLPLLRQSLFQRLMTIDGIRPPPQHVVPGFAVTGMATQMTQLPTSVRPQMVTQTVRVVAPLNAAGQSLNVTTPRAVVGGVAQRLVTPIRGQIATQGKILTPLRGVTPMATSTQPPPLHPTAPMVRLATTGKVAGKAAMGKAPPGKAVLRPTAPLPVNKSLSKAVRGFDTASFGGDDDINDVAAMGGVNLAEESQRILGSTEFVGTQIRSVKDELFLHTIPLQNKVRQIVSSHGLEEPSAEVLALISHACQERLKTLVEKLACIAEHRIDVIKLDPRYEVTQDVKGQLKFLEELDRLERKRHEEHERELLLRAAKSRSKSEDPEQVKLKAKAKEMQRAEMEELRQREANITALQAIGPRKKPRLDMPGGSTDGISAGGSSGQFARPQPPLRPRLKRVNLRDLLFLLEQEREPARTKLLYKSYLK